MSVKPRWSTMKSTCVKAVRTAFHVQSTVLPSRFPGSGNLNCCTRRGEIAAAHGSATAADASNGRSTFGAPALGNDRVVDTTVVVADAALVVGLSDEAGGG
nr:hypothetical protein [Herbihabitans rhizosphaerae]